MRPRRQSTILPSKNLRPNNKKTYRLTAALIERAHDFGIDFVWPGVEPVKQGNCIDLNLLKSAAEQPYQECFDREMYPSLAEKAAYIFYHLASGHVFGNGNKRTATVCLDTFLLANSQYLTLSNEEVHDLAQAVASAGERGVKFHDELARITALIESNLIPVSTFRLTNKKAYRQLLKGKNAIRNSPLSRHRHPLSQKQ